jgi:hypothetical protein
MLVDYWYQYFLLPGALFCVPVGWFYARLAVRFHPAALRDELLATIRFEYVGAAIFNLLAWSIITFLPQGSDGQAPSFVRGGLVSSSNAALIGLLGSAWVASMGWRFWQSSEQVRRYRLPDGWADRYGYDGACYRRVGLYLAAATAIFVSCRFGLAHRIS